MTVGLLLSFHSVAQAQSPEAASPQAKPELNDTAVQDQATRVPNSYCVSCHGPKKQEGDVRLGALETLDPVDRQALFAKVQDVVQLRDMPP